MWSKIVDVTKLAKGRDKGRDKGKDKRRDNGKAKNGPPIFYLTCRNLKSQAVLSLGYSEQVSYQTMHPSSVKVTLWVCVIKAELRGLGVKCQSSKTSNSQSETRPYPAQRSR